MKASYSKVIEIIYEELGRYLTIGLVSKEIMLYAKDKIVPRVGVDQHTILTCVREHIPALDTGHLLENLGGRNRFATSFPGKYVYYRGELQGYPRVILELINKKSIPESSCFNILNDVFTLGGSANKQEIESINPMSRNEFDRKINLLMKFSFISPKEGRYELTSLSRGVFSSEILEKWTELQGWKYKLSKAKSSDAK